MLPLESCNKSFVNEQLLRLQASLYLGITDVYVHPDYRRQGIGARLTKVPLEEADKLGLPVYIEATAEGGKLYISLGFEIKKELSHDLAPYGVDAEPYVNYMMWREARLVEA